MSARQILIIKGVFLSDLTPKARSAKLAPQSTSIKVYNDLPNEFTGVSSWPKNINLKCWICDKIPEDYPKFIPFNPRRDSAGNFRCSTKGVFHKWNCAASYIDSHIPDQDKRETRQLLCLVESIFSGKRRVFIPPSPPKTDLREYCGDTGLTRAEYDSKLDEIDAHLSIYA